MNFPAADYLEFTQTEHTALFAEEANTSVWAAIHAIAGYLNERLDRVEGPLLRGEVDERAIVGARVYVAPGAVVEANAVIKGPAWIGPGTVVRGGAYLREDVIAGSDCVLGNSSEFKNCLLFNHCEVPHFSYVGDSILGYKAHLGAGVICSNVRLDRRSVTVRDGKGDLVDTGLRKFGAIIGDRTEVGCNSVLSPGSVLGRDCVLYPLVSWQGVLPAHQIVKNRTPLQIVERHGEK